MGCCTGRCILVTICTLQLVSTVQRQVFDFLGYMWAPIITNFLQIIFIIIGLFGTCQYRPKVVIVYAAWCLLWIGWNVFVICLYLEIGILSRESPILSLGTGYKSWWLENGIGCTVSKNYTNQLGSTAVFTNRRVPPESAVTGCLLQYQYVEIIQAGVQCLLALFGFITACYVVHSFSEEDDSSQPVSDELEYIKMRYKSPARSSFRDNKTYETLNRSTLQTTLDHRGLEGPQTDIEAYSLRSNSTRGRNYPNTVQSQTRPHYDSNLPWVRISPSPQRRVHDNFDHRHDYIGQADYFDQESVSSSPPPSYHQYGGAYDVVGATHGITVI